MNLIKVGPGDFINPPFLPCPKCGGNSFGIMCIAAHQYSRRCKKCLYPTHPERHAPTPLPRLDKKILYIDQFVISKMMYALNHSSEKHGSDPNEPFFKEVFERLDRLGKKQLLVCPSSEFHDAESLPSSCFEALKKMYELLAYGVRWHDSEQVRTYLIMEAFRRWQSGLAPQESQFTKDGHLYGDRTAWSSCFYVPSHLRFDANLVDEIRSIRDSTAEGLREVFEQWQKDQDKDFDFWVLEEKRATAKRYVNGLMNQVHEIATAQEEILDTQTVSLNAVAAYLPSHEANIMLNLRMALINVGCAEDQWMLKAWEFLQSEHFMELSFVKIGTMVWATVAHRLAHGGQKRLPTKGFSNDVSFIETYLPYCDAIFVDRECHGILSDHLMQSALEKYGTKVFSLTNWKEFLEYLESIESSATSDHTARLNEVYGEKYLKPFVTLYDANFPDGSKHE